MMRRTTPYIRFVIIGSHRSGSNYLSSLLSSHPNIMSVGELYNPSVLYAKPGKPRLHESVLAKTVRNAAPVWFLKTCIFHPYPEKYHAVGFRYFYLHAQGKFRSVLDYLREQTDIHVIHLKRLNFLRSFVSLNKAQKTGIWTVSSSSGITQPNISFSLSASACRAYFEFMEEQIRTFSNLFVRHPVLETRYESLCNDKKRQQQKLAIFLGVEPRRLTAKTKQLGTISLRSSLQNYDALKRKFEKTKWSVFFDEE